MSLFREKRLGNAFRGLLIAAALFLIGPLSSRAQTTFPSGNAPSASAFRFSMGSQSGNERENVSSGIQIVVVMTILTLAPSIVFMMTSFTRIVIVLGFLRNALGVQNAPSNQIMIGIALFLTMFIMAPVWTEIQTKSLDPYMAEQLNSKEALAKAVTPMKQFMLRQTRTSEVEFFLGLAGTGPTTIGEVPITVVIPAFLISELRTSFQMGLMIFVPFLVIDFLVAATLMSMGMMMMPPTVVSLPFKILLFVLVDGWHLIVRSLVQSFAA